MKSRNPHKHRFFRPLLIEGLHRREQQYVPDCRAVSEEHYHAVDAYAYAASGRHTVFESEAEVLVYHHGFVVTLAALLRLLNESAGQWGR